MTDKIDSQEHHESVDTKYLQVLIQLRKLGLLKKEDIKSYGLLSKLCDQKYFAEKRIRFLVEWDPSTLLHPEQRDELLPLHYAIGGCPSPAMQRLQFVFEYGIHYFPKKKGISLLFKKNNHGRYTPFQYACKRFGEEQVIKMIEDTFIRYYSSSDDTPPLNVVDALMTAAIDEGIHLDCVYFLLRRQPDILQKLLSSASNSTTAKATVDIVVFTSNGNGINPKKRKR
ncbi:hypothetical protein FRACYDRAFT_229549 [Fragilariopsis cylindrus CCMP1102]|uniref:Uncharacterized protein n=1 Tax=Fragilariopsis cylindrus CCMP1102 TaxID=635003 RepID=A0A1E7ENJ4_9STRA|nr:hypothetical protein FRACYDRAFT_229549 [Fragilariopsis cylindrus CCMP1102]|eukprot:OEU07386.1 hypothetical protein FRACYDRAFT_229549 [Fragilariopsis cylindrus CCMP1102]